MIFGLLTRQHFKFNLLWTTGAHNLNFLDDFILVAHYFLVTVDLWP